jgi:hypothetical protein
MQRAVQAKEFPFLSEGASVCMQTGVRENNNAAQVAARSW